MQTQEKWGLEEDWGEVRKGECVSILQSRRIFYFLKFPNGEILPTRLRSQFNMNYLNPQIVFLNGPSKKLRRFKPLTYRQAISCKVCQLRILDCPGWQLTSKSDLSKIPFS